MNNQGKILVIDDDPAIRDTLEALLSAEGYQVEVAQTGKEAIAKTEETWFNLVLIDIRLPDLSGIELLTKLKDGTPKMRKIIVTGFPTLPNAVEALNKQADAYLMKPVDVSQMLEIIKEQLALQRGEITFSEAKIGEYIKTRARDFLDKQKNSDSRKP